MAVMTRPGQSLIDALAAELAARSGGTKSYGTKAVSSTPSTPYLHGPNGLWSYPGLERPVISTRVIPRGIAGMIPARPNNSMNPLYPYLTGFTNPSETNPDGVCDDPPTAGQMKNCFQFAQYGRYSYQTRVMEITRLGQIINRGEFTDLMLMNNAIGIDGGNAIVNPSQGPDTLSLVNEASARWAEVAIKFQNKLMKQLWYDNPANNTGGGGYKEFAGIDRLIRTGVVDAVTGQTCPSLDSIVVDANYRKVDDLTGAPANANLINVITYTWRSLRDLANRTNMSPVRWVIAMRETLFYELSAVWPCNYLSYRCQAFNFGSGTELIIDAGDAIALRDSMRSEQFLIIDGMRVDVVFDDAIDEETSGDTSRVDATCFASDIYFLPLSVQGNKATLFWEYFAFNGPNAALSDSVMAAMPLASNFYWTDGGQYIWHMKPPTNWCVQWLGLIEPRMVLLTPHLSAVIRNVQYCPLMHTRDAFPDDPYFVDGGVTSRDTAPSWYKSWTV